MALTKEKSKTNKGEFSIISLKFLSELTGIAYQRLYSNLILKVYDSFTDNDKTTLANAMFAEVKKAFKVLGFKITIERIN
jgi:hypothetical protein